MHAAHEAGELHEAAVTNLFRGKDRVMMASRALEGAAYMSNLVFTARRRGSWIPMPRYEPIGVEVHRAATNASAATSRARQLIIATAKPVVATLGPTAAATVGFAHGRIAAPGAAVPSSADLIKAPATSTGSAARPSVSPTPH